MDMKVYQIKITYKTYFIDFVCPSVSKHTAGRILMRFGTDVTPLG